jgi:hypothetical protein
VDWVVKLSAQTTATNGNTSKTAREFKREQILLAIEQNPELSNRAIARLTDASHVTVAELRTSGSPYQNGPQIRASNEVERRNAYKARLDGYIEELIAADSLLTADQRKRLRLKFGR